MNKLKQITSGLSFRVLIGIVLLLYTFNIIISLAGYFQFTASFTRQYNDFAFYTAETAATLVNGDKIQEYLETGGNSDEYRIALERMNVLCQKQNVTLIYVISVDTSDYNHFRSVFNTVNESTGYTPWEVGYERETTNEKYRQIYKNLYENGLERETVARTSSLRGREPHITSLIPIKNSQGKVTAILCVEKPMTELSSGRRGYLRFVAASTILLTLFACICVAIYLRKQFITPINKIIEEAKRFAKENNKMSHEAFGKISRIHELNALASSVEKMETDTLQYMENLRTVTAEKERINAELSLASDIQLNMLPSIFPAFPDHDEFDVYATMTPAKEVGGDFYDFFLIDEKHIAIVIADVSGKGVPAALFMVIAKTLIKNHTQLGLPVHEVFSSVNKLLCEGNDADLFVTAWLGILDLTSGCMTFVNAGHNPPLLCQNGLFQYLKAPAGFVLAGIDTFQYKQNEITLTPGDRIFLYTDGVTEATDLEQELYGEERLINFMNQHTADSAKDVLHELKADIYEFVGEAPQFDDITMLMFDYIQKMN